jgi:3-hydroxyacyl-CoA dehydrogenase/enoyl-CoA hydratase/3-hydroxybutyryl-CoA epimerase
MPKALVIRSAKEGGFAAGADISEFKVVTDDPETLLKEGHAVLDRLAALSCPTICVVHGAALGAGFEIALACDIRIGVKGASFAFPEVLLGLHPGLGGTFRSVALIDPIEAMTLMLNGIAHTRKRPGHWACLTPWSKSVTSRPRWRRRRMASWKGMSKG